MKSKKTANYFRLQQFINDRFDELENDHFSKWIFIKHKPVNVKYLNGKNISYSGVGFDGSPMQVFWNKNYIPKYIEDFCFKGVEAALENSNKLKISPNKCLDEFKIVLHAEIGKIFGKMADIDSKLRGDGINIPPKRNVISDIEELKSQTDQIIKSFQKINQVWDELFVSEQARIIHLLVRDVIIKPEGININIYRQGLNSLNNEIFG